MIGYVFGYDLTLEYAQLSPYIDFNNPDKTILELKNNKTYNDVREGIYKQIQDNLVELIALWVLFWTADVSIKREDINAIDRFDEDFTSWGMEDIECGYRLYTERKVKFKLSRKACAIHYPHERNNEANTKTNQMNKIKLFKKHPCDVTELYTVSKCYTFNAELKKIESHMKETKKVIFSDIFKKNDLVKLNMEFIGYNNIIFGCQDGFLVDICKSSAATENDNAFFQT
ncbi:MAG: hypothetical protein IMZ59_00860 [Actinobacteria bacterium]|nr:hypothetical protein [Actinomycetota bacterium]